MMTVIEQAQAAAAADARLRQAAGDFIRGIVEALPERFEARVDNIRIYHGRIEFVHSDGREYQLPLELDSIPAEALTALAHKVAAGWADQLTVLLRERTAEYNDTARLFERIVKGY